MNDLISRQAAIVAICKAGCSLSNPCRVFCPDVMAVKEVPSANQWIPVSERLPEDNGRYLATRGLYAAGNTWNRVYIVNYSDLMGLIKGKIFWIGNVGKNDFERIQDVVAWMPLPEPYKEEE